MASKLALLTVVVASLCCRILALPNPGSSSQKSDGIERRNNKYNLKCSNAPSTVAGDFLDPSQVPALPQTLPQTGASTQPWQYLWCTPGTKTYTFFASYPLTPPPLDYINFAAALNASGNSYANQADIDVPDGSFTNDPAGTNVQVHMENAKGGKLTWGIANSALAGLWQFSSVYAVGSQRQNPIAFEVNDGQWGEIAIGYAGFLRPSDGTCLLQIYQGTEKDCSKLSDLID